MLDRINKMVEEIKTTLRDLGYGCASVLVRDEFNGHSGVATWAITIVRNGQSLQVEYTSGCANRHYPKSRRPIKLPTFQKLSQYQFDRNKRTLPDKPILVDVMYAVVSDAQMVMNGQTFEDFASELGYNEDSRKGEKAWLGCVSEWRGLIRMGADMDGLGRLFQDY